VGRAVPSHVDEADELPAVSSTDPAQAVPIDLTPPVIVKEAMPEALGVQGVDLGVLEITTPLVVDVHAVEHRPGIVVGRRIFPEERPLIH